MTQRHVVAAHCAATTWRTAARADTHVAARAYTHTSAQR